MTLGQPQILGFYRDYNKEIENRITIEALKLYKCSLVLRVSDTERICWSIRSPEQTTEIFNDTIIILNNDYSFKKIERGYCYRTTKKMN